jgi:hypothetical protein
MAFLDFWPINTVLGFLPFPSLISISPVYGFISVKLIFINSLALAPVSNKHMNMALSRIPWKLSLAHVSIRAFTVSRILVQVDPGQP